VTLLIGAGLLVILVLGVYAGKLLFQLKAQSQQQHIARQARIDNITQSIRTIALAMEQQQCNLSEGVIRICNLLGAIPVNPRPNYLNEYPMLHQLYEKIQQFDTHDARSALSKTARRNQDNAREQLESEYEVKVLQEIGMLKSLVIKRQ
jgi:hypothetical protein